MGPSAYEPGGGVVQTQQGEVAGRKHKAGAKTNPWSLVGENFLFSFGS